MKIFCVGFHKTGTSSLGVALETLGYRVTGPNGIHANDLKNEVMPMAFQLVEQYDAFQDNPWPLIYKEMDRAYPNSKFILTVRNPTSWIASQVNHFGFKETPMRKWIYGVGCPQGNEKIYLDRYKRHNSEVIDYFGRRKDFVVMDLEKGDGWDELCGVLEIDRPKERFPHINKNSERKKIFGFEKLKRYFR